MFISDYNRVVRAKVMASDFPGILPALSGDATKNPASWPGFFNKKT
jgi:hypothetical protein